MGDFICKKCNLTFDTAFEKANHVRWKHQDNTETNRKISEKATERYLIKNGELKEYKVICENCNTEFFVFEREKKHPEKKKYFCSRSCANTRNHSNETKEKIGKSMSIVWKSDEYAQHIINANTKKSKRFSSKGEREIRNILKKIYTDTSSQRIIKLSDNTKRAVDIQIKSLNVIIEYDGIWHFKKVHENHDFDTQHKKDILEEEYCKLNNIKLIRISNERYIKNKEECLKLLFEALYNKTDIYKIY